MAISLDKLGRENKRLALIIMVSVVVLYIDYSFIIRLQLASIRSTSTKSIKLSKDLNALNKDLALMQKSQQEAQKSGKKTKKIISEGELTALLQDIFKLANKDNVKINQIKPVRDQKAKEEAFGSLKAIPITLVLDISSVYHEFGSFINDLENAEQFLAVQELRILRTKEDYLRQYVSLKLKTYVKK